MNHLKRLVRPVLFLVALGATTPLFAVPYEGVVIEDVVSGPAPTIYLGGLEDAVRRLGVHARRFPLAFDNKDQRAMAVADTQRLSDLLDAPTRVAGMPSDLLALSGELNTFAWRLGYDRAAGRALNQLSTALAADPGNVALRYLLGSFLSEFGDATQLAMDHLEKAYDAGMIEAAWTLGMLHMRQRNPQAARPYIEAFAVRTRSKDPQVRKMLDVVRVGTLLVIGGEYPSLPADVDRARLAVAPK